MTWSLSSGGLPPRALQVLTAASCHASSFVTRNEGGGPVGDGGGDGGGGYGGGSTSDDGWGGVGGDRGGDGGGGISGCCIGMGVVHAPACACGDGGGDGV